MKAILKLVSSRAQAVAATLICKNNNLVIVHRKHGFALDEDMIALQRISLNFGGYGTSFSIAFDQRFKNSWGLAHARKTNPIIYSGAGSLKEWDRMSIDYEEKANNSFLGLKFFFSDMPSSAIFERDLKWVTPLSELKEQIEKLGGQYLNSIQDANVIVTMSERVEIPHESNVLVVSQEILNNALSIKKTTSPSTKITFSSEAKKIWKLLSTKDVISINQGLKLAETLPEKIDELTAGCSCNSLGEIMKSPMFSGTKSAEAYLDYALIGLLSLAAPASQSEKIRRSLKKIKLYLKEIPFMRGFDSLEELSIELPSNSSVTLKNLSNFGEFLNLKRLKIFTSGWRNDVLKSLDGLIASNLEEISAASLGLKDITALKNMRKLKDIDLSRNPELKDISALASSTEVIEKLDLSNCDKLQSIQPIIGAKKLKQIKLDCCDRIESLEALRDSINLEVISVDGSSLSSLNGLEHVKLKNVEIRYIFKVRDTVMLKDFINLMPTGDDQSFTISELTIQKD